MCRRAYTFSIREIATPDLIAAVAKAVTRSANLGAELRVSVERSATLREEAKSLQYECHKLVRRATEQVSRLKRGLDREANGTETLDDVWRERVQSARRRYKDSQVLSQRALWERDSLPSPDGSFGFQHALQAETAALKEYARVLNIFNALVLHGKVPPEE
jgi:hypothetical protein